jgi:hypothetical protein
MSFEERRTWIEIVVALVVPGWYFASVLSQARTTQVTDIEYQWLLGLSVVILIVSTVIGIIATSIAALIRTEIAVARAGGREGDPERTTAMAKALDRSDERDVAIGRLGGQAGFTVLGVTVLVPLGLAMAEREPFWIANAIYAALVLSSLAFSAAKLVAYRRGL